MASNPRVRIVLDLFDRYYESVVRFARRSVDAATADDVSQEVFARLLRLPDLEHKDIRASYLIKIAENLIRRRYQRERRFAERAPRLAFGLPGDDHAPGHRSTDADETHRRAREAVSALDDRERRAVELVVGLGLTYREAAASMGVKVSDVNNWRHRGVEKMRRTMEGARYDRAE